MPRSSAGTIDERDASTGRRCATMCCAMSTGWSGLYTRRSTTTRSSISTSARRSPGRTRCGWPAGARSPPSIILDRDRRLAGHAANSTGSELGITSNEVFHLPALPQAGGDRRGRAISRIEFAGIFNAARLRCDARQPLATRSCAAMTRSIARSAAADHAWRKGIEVASSTRPFEQGREAGRRQPAGPRRRGRSDPGRRGAVRHRARAQYRRAGAGGRRRRAWRQGRDPGRRL